MMAPRDVRRSARIGGAAALIAAVCFSSFLLSRWTHSAPSAGGGFVSELEAPGQPYAWLYRFSDVLAGLGILTAAWALRPFVPGHRWSVASVVLLALTGASSIVDGATTMRWNPGTSSACARQEHTVGGLLGFAASAVGAIMLGAVLADRWPGWGRLQIGLGTAIGGCGIADIALLLASGDIGSVERVRVLLTSGWFMVIGFFLLRSHVTSRVRTRRPGPTAPAGRREVAS